MSKRSRSVIAISVALVLIGGIVLWLTVFRNQPATPAMQPKKTTGELLVGSWDMIKIRDKELPEMAQVVCDYGEDGRFEFRIKDPFRGVEEVCRGTYRLEGNTLWHMAEASKGHEAKTWNIHIETITEDTLVTIARANHPLDNSGESERAEFIRRPTK